LAELLGGLVTGAGHVELIDVGHVLDRRGLVEA
jgi:hypothetical protein